MVNRKMLLALCAIALLFLSFGCVGGGQSSSFGCGQTSTGTTAWVCGWNMLAFLAVAIVSLLLALGYMAATFLGDDKMKAFVKKELGQLVISVLLILFITSAFVYGMDTILKNVIIGGPGITTQGWQDYVSNAVCCEPGTGGCLAKGVMPCHIAVAMDFLQTIYGSLNATALSYFYNHWFSAFLSFLNVSLSARVVVSMASLSIRPFAGLSMNSDMYSILFDLAMKNMMLVRVQQIFIDFFLIAFFPVMLSMGLVLRVFYFTRKLGGLLIALSLAMYYVFPMFYVLSNAILFQLVAQPAGGTGAGTFGMGIDQSQPLPFTKNTLLTPNGISSISGVETFLDSFVNDPASQAAMHGKIDAFGIDAATTLTITGDDARQYIIEKDYGSGSLVYDIYSAPLNFQADPEQAFAANAPTNLMNICGGTSQPSSNEPLNLFKESWDSLEGGALMKSLTTFSSFTAFDIGGPMASLAAIMIFTLITPFLALMTTLAAFKAFSGLIGGDIEIALISRLL